MEASIESGGKVAGDVGRGRRPAGWQARAIAALVDAVARNEALLTDLDAALGDADHGTNLLRGLRAVAGRCGQAPDGSLAALLTDAGTLVVAHVGGASGALYGTLLMAMGNAASDGPRPEPAEIARLLGIGVDAVRRRGRSDVGQKTMLDVLVPVAEAVRDGVAGGMAAGMDGDGLWRSVRAAARRGVESTRALRASRGRGAFLEERSVGLIDPGAMSSFLMVECLCLCLGIGDEGEE